MANKNLREMFQGISENIDLGEDFNIEDIPNLELPENFNKDFHNKYLTVTSAKNNDEVRAHYRAKYLSSVDLKLKNKLINLGGSQEDFEKLKSEEPDSLKLGDLVIDKVIELNSSKVPISNDKEFENYKKETSEQIRGLLLKNEDYESNFKSKIEESNKSWVDKLKNTKINAKLMAKRFDSGIDTSDAIYLTERKIKDSDFVLHLDEELNERVYDKNNPEMEAIVDGKSIDWDYVIDKFSQTYTQKNNQESTRKKEVVVVDSASVGDGKYIVGHADYGK